MVDPKNDYDLISSLDKNEVFKSVPINSVFIDSTYSDFEKTTFSESFLEKDRYNLFLANLKEMGIFSNLDLPFIAESEIKDYLKFKDTMTFNKELADTAAPGGVCIPGGKKLFVDVHGNFFPCERISETAEVFKIGNLKEGFNIEKTNALLNVGKITSKECKNCWAFLHCLCCVKYTEKDGKLSRQKKLEHCNSTKSIVRYNLMKFILFKEVYEKYDIF